MYHIPVISNQENIAQILDDLYLEELDFQVISVFDENFHLEELDGAVLFYFEEDEEESKNRMMQQEILKHKKNNRECLTMVVLRSDGVTSLRKALELHVDEVIIRSDYAREADFVKKRQEILRSLVYRFILQKKTIFERMKLEEYEFHSKQKFMDQLLANILEKPEEVEYLLPEINNRYHTRFGTGVYQVMVISMDRYDLYNKDTSYVKDVTILAMHILRIVRQIVFGSYKLYGLVAVLHYPDFATKEQRKMEWLRLKKEIEKLSGKYGAFTLHVGVGEERREFQEIPDSFLEALLVVEYLRYGERELYLAEDFIEPVQPVTKYVPANKIKELIRYVSLGDIPHVNSWFCDFYQQIEGRFAAYPPAYARFTWAVYLNILELEKKAGITLFPEWKFITIQHIMNGRQRMEAFQNALIEICHMLKNGISEKQEIALRAIAYMQAHYHEQITLDAIAESCGLSPSYFSRKFKEQTGENYIETLANIRIQEAQKLLGSTKLSIMEIVEKVGYCDEKHFRKLFLKHAGVTPSVYRKTLKAQKDEVGK